MNQKEIEAAGAEEYALWRSTKDRVNSIKEYMVANATTHLNRLDKVMGAAKAGDMEPMTNMMLDSVGGGIAGVTKKVGKAGKDALGSYLKKNYSKKELKAMNKAGKEIENGYDPSYTKKSSYADDLETQVARDSEPMTRKQFDALEEQGQLSESFKRGMDDSFPAKAVKKKGPKPDYTPKVKQPTPQSGTADVMEQLEFNKNIDVIEYFKPVKTKAQMAAAVNALKHRFSNYDRLVVGIGKNNYNKMQESIYGSLEKTLAGKQMNQQSQWARELYVEKMRGLGVL